MFTTVVTVLCHLLVSSPTLAPDTDCTSEEARVEEIVTDSSLDENMNFFTCMIHGQHGVADWKMNHPIYRSPSWRVARIKCVPGHYEIKGNI